MSQCLKKIVIEHDHPTDLLIENNDYREIMIKNLRWQGKKKKKCLKNILT